jgi:hypothetical protein
MILPSDLQLVLRIWRTLFFKFEARQTAITGWRGLSHPIGWAALSSENISWRFFLKGGETL